jgi:FkbM family methyltransferase
MFKIYKFLIKCLFSFLSLFSELKNVSAQAYFIENSNPVMDVKTNAGNIKLYSPSELLIWRATTYNTKEPSTLEWIDSFKEKSVLWDIGANIGLYSLYAAKKSDCEVYAFEPSAFNFPILNKNIEINNLDSKISALCLAVSEKTMIDKLNMPDTSFGGALNCFADTVDMNGKQFSPSYSQGTLGVSIDDLVSRFDLVIPNYIKIDVDGIENLIIKGAVNTLSNSKVESVLVELEDDQPEECEYVISTLKNSGLELTDKKTY